MFCVQRLRAGFLFAIGCLIAFEGRANAEWSFLGDCCGGKEAYLRSVDTPQWNVNYDADLNHSFASRWDDNPQVMQVGTGDYHARFIGLETQGEWGGNVQVSALGTGNEHCIVLDWGTVGTDVDVHVRCFDADGNMANSLFTLSYVRRINDPYGSYPVGPEGAYLWACMPSSDFYDVSNCGYAWNSTYQPSSVTRSGLGVYTVRLEGQNGGVLWGYPTIGDCNPDKGGTVEVTAYGSNAFCQADVPTNQVTWQAAGDDTYIDVWCFDGVTGNSTDSMFTLSYDTISPNASQSGGYAYANEIFASNYVPQFEFRQQFIDTGDGNDFPHCFPGNNPQPVIDRLGTGVYSVFFPLLEPFSDHVKVTTGQSPNTATRCKIDDWWAEWYYYSQKWNQGIRAQVSCRYYSDYWHGLGVDQDFFINVSTQAFNH